MFIADKWRDYEILDVGNGEKLERWGDIVLRRPDPQAIWPPQDINLWDKADAIYRRHDTGGGEWEFKRNLPESWTVSYRELKFIVRPTGFKHTGLFPEQAVNWDWMAGLIKGAGGKVNVLNLFGYTGGATIACAAAGAHVTHLEASRGMALWAGENRRLNGLAEGRIRWIIDDAKKFVLREARRGVRYDAILMDPPKYGRGPGGELWKLEDELYGLADACADILSDAPLCMLINSYTTGLQPVALQNILSMTAARKRSGSIASGEIALPITGGGLLPCGACARYSGNGNI
jgi:23S rRNA (cytosine1962-C5)-methyltransferase